VVLGLFPGLVLGLVAGPVSDTLAAVGHGAPVALGLWP
jgi:hypothetical protein